jgi:DNA-binding NarL/FixJ family response regulator
MDSLRIFLVDCRPIVRRGLRSLLIETPGLRVIGEAAALADLLAALPGLTADLAIVDARSTGMNPLEGLQQLKHAAPRMRILVFTAERQPAAIARALGAGADGYITEDEDESVLVDAIRRVQAGAAAVSTGFSRSLRPAGAEVASNGTPPLSVRENEILLSVARGLSSKMIAEELGISYTTVNKHIEHIKRKLRISRRTALVRYALAGGQGTVAPDRG